jgi:predicted nucleic acid-binding protein
MNQSQKNTSADQFYLDSNVLLEIILDRPNQDRARKFIEAHLDNLFISTLTAHLIVHFGQKIVTLDVLSKFLSDYTILTLDSTDFDWAFNNARNQDFEDALQLSVGIRNGCNQFITFDKKLVKTYEDLPIIKTILL